MQLFLVLLPLLTTPVLGAIGSLCKANKVTGTCQTTKWCKGRNGQQPVTGACPNDPADVKCCLFPDCDDGVGMGCFLESECYTYTHPSMSGAEQLQVLCHSLMFGRLVEMERIVRQTSYKLWGAAGVEVSLAAAVPVAEVVITPAGRGEVSKPVAVTAGGRIVILATPIHVQALAYKQNHELNHGDAV
ncbi:hypothetical protein MCOR02_001079 [Pyricularia oryzae]|nr:hypothetical protein MCOR02_001079 [Pyricularia oryzae]